MAAAIRAGFVAMLLLASASCGSTEPGSADGRFDLAMSGSMEQRLSGLASVDGGGLGARGLQLYTPADSTGRSEWRFTIFVQGYTDPVAGEVLPISKVADVSPTPAAHTASVLISYQSLAPSVLPVRGSWSSTSGELRIESISATRISGTIVLDAAPSFSDTRPGTLSVRGSFSAICPSTQCHN